MAGNAATPGRACPNCGKFVPARRVLCPSCQLATSKMAGFEAAKRAAQKKGVASAKDDAPAPLWRRPVPVIAVLLAVLIGAGIYAKFSAPKVPEWSKFPSTREDAVQQFLTHIAAGTDDEYNKAYALIAPSQHDPKANDESGDYRQLFNYVNKYLTGEFGDNWDKTAKIAQDATNPDLMVATVGLETLHVPVTQQTPTEIMGGNENNAHYAIIAIQEFNILDAAGFRSNEAQTAVVKSIAGQGAIDNLQTVMGAMGGTRRENPMQKKYRLLPILRNPREATWQAVVQTWPLRKDPVIRNRMEQIAGDDRYDPQVKKTAKEVLTDSVSDEELIAVGVDN